MRQCYSALPSLAILPCEQTDVQNTAFSTRLVTECFLDRHLHCIYIAGVQFHSDFTVPLVGMG